MVGAKQVLFWLMLGGFVWVVGDIFQQYAAKYVGISRGIPLSNTNQLWGLAWGILVFGELHGRGAFLHVQVIAGSVIMVVGAALIASSSVTSSEHVRWQEAAQRESLRYGIDDDYVQAGLSGAGRATEPIHVRRSWLDWFLIFTTTAVFIVLATQARRPELKLNWTAAIALSAALFIFLLLCGRVLWRTTRFN
jgi:hypothetical protein